MSQFFRPMPTFEGSLHRIFELIMMRGKRTEHHQRQSAGWASRGFGISLLDLAKGIRRASGRMTRLRRPASRSHRNSSNFASIPGAPVPRVFGPAIPPH